MRVPGYMDNGAVSWGFSTSEGHYFLGGGGKNPTDNIGMFFGFFAPVHCFKCCSNILTNNEGFANMEREIKNPICTKYRTLSYF